MRFLYFKLKANVLIVLKWFIALNANIYIIFYIFMMCV